MIIAIDIETQGLDATKYITGCLLKEHSKKPEIFRNKDLLWERVLELGFKEAKRGKVLTVYSHNASFDTAGYVDLTDKHLKFFSHRPFIWAYQLSSKECDESNVPHQKGKGKEIIKFLDTWSIMPMSLKEVGQTVGIEKHETPPELLEDQLQLNLTEKKLQEIEKYMVRDTRICLKIIDYMKDLLQKDEIKLQRLYTINQIAIQALIHDFKKLPDEYQESLFWNKMKGQIRRTFRKEEIHEAYRGGRVEAFQTGVFESVNYVDCNSLYPFSAIHMKFPELRSERKITDPLNKDWTITELLSKIGLSQCCIFNHTNNYGLLPVRTEAGSFYPKSKTMLIGTYTHQELALAIQEGYEILSIAWSVVYDETKNPFKLIFPELYEKRFSDKNVFVNYYYKRRLNAGIGKLAQYRHGQEILLDSVEKYEEYLFKKYKVLAGLGTNYLYKKDLKPEIEKPYYMPIVPCLINAYARCYMYQFLKKIPQKDLLYSDTDSVIFLNNHFNKFPITTKMGDFKIVAQKEKCIIYGRKTYSIGKELKIAGFNQRSITAEQFEEGFIETKKMITLQTTTDLKKIGTFETEKRNLHTQQENHQEIYELLKKETILIDSQIENIEFYQDCLTNKSYMKQLESKT